MQTSAPCPVTVSTLTAALSEWDRRWREEPDRFMSEAQHLLKETPETYGEAAGPYLMSILQEQLAGDAKLVSDWVRVDEAMAYARLYERALATAKRVRQLEKLERASIFIGTTNETDYTPQPVRPFAAICFHCAHPRPAPVVDTSMTACSGCARSAAPAPAPTVVLIGPQGCGKSTHAQAFAQAFGCTHVIDGESLNGFDVDDPAAITREGALIIGPERTEDCPRADLVIEARTKAGFDKAVALLPSAA
jgi:hypothetical protein